MNLTGMFTNAGPERKPKFYVDLHQKQIDKEALKACEDLKDVRIPEALEAGNIFRYDVDWLGISGQKYGDKDDAVRLRVHDGL